MKEEDYLWDKTGEDPEIEKLENALLSFRYRESVPPAAFDGKVLPFKREPSLRRRIFSFQLAAAAACVSFFAAIAFSVWLQISRNETEARQEFAETAAAIQPTDKAVSLSEQSGEQTDDSIAGKPEKITALKVETSVKSATRETFAARRFASAVTYRREATAKNNKFAGRNKAKTRTVRLTGEERFAYNQLLLALSITSSQLKSVRDKIEGGEQQTAAAAETRR